MKYKLKLLPEELLIQTNPIDHADWNYRPFLGFLQRRRFHLAISLIDNFQYNQILEIGYGSGIFMPTLAEKCKELFGIDIHPVNQKVSDRLSDYGISAHLFQGSVSQMPFVNESFDLIVSISTFEFIEDKRAACREIRRVLKKDGLFIIITPSESWLLDTGFNILTRQSAKNDFGNERKKVIPIIKEYFNISKSKMFPPIIGHICPVYKAFVLRSKN